LLFLAHEWAPTEKIHRSFELFARYVAPRFQGALESVEGSQQFVARNKGTIFSPTAAAITNAFTDAGLELPEEMRRMQELRARTREKQGAPAD
jgi:limonene 1,2-monooxygenase